MAKGVSLEDVKRNFANFGEEVTDEEAAQFVGMGLGPETTAAIANYAMTRSAQLERQANDPLNAVLAAEKSFTSAQEAMAAGDIEAAKGFYGELEGLLKQAPQLFGNLQPEQIDQYLAPVKQQFAQADAMAQGSAAKRGLAGSSTEMAIQGELGNQFRGQVLSKGLEVGMKQQQLQAQAIQDEITRRTQLAGTHTGAAVSGYGLQNQSAGQLSTLSAEDQAIISSLPLYLRAAALQEGLAKKAASKKASPWGAVGTLAGGAIGSFILPGIGTSIGASIGGGIGNLASGNYDAAATNINTAYQTPLLMGRSASYEPNMSALPV